MAEKEKPLFTASTPTRASAHLPRRDSQIVLLPFDPSPSSISTNQSSKQQQPSKAFPTTTNGHTITIMANANGTTDTISSPISNSSNKRPIRCGRCLFVAIVGLMALVMAFNLELEGLFVKWDIIPQQVQPRQHAKADHYNNVVSLKEHDGGAAISPQPPIPQNVVFSADPGSADNSADNPDQQPGQQQPSLKSLWAGGLGALPALPIKAAEALACRDSVVNFVINATDGKDECDGLKKAFEKTCSNDSEDDRAAKKPEASAVVEEEGPAAEDAEQGPHRKKRRKLADGSYSSRQPTGRMSDKLYHKAVPDWRLFSVQVSRTLHRWVRRGWNLIRTSSSVSNQVVEEWDSAENLVRLDLDWRIHKDLIDQLERATCESKGTGTCNTERTRRVLAANDSSNKINNRTAPIALTAAAALGNTTIAGNTTDDESPPKSLLAPSNKTKLHLDLPLGVGHKSDKVMSETLMLQQGDKLIDKVNQTQAKAHAAESSKAVHDASAVVEAVLNDPSSIEARTCCASILNVYHDNCSTDEEEAVSDVRLFFGVAVMALCGMTKSLIRHFKILWLPEAAGCIIVGVLSGYALMVLPQQHEISFDGNWFLRIMVPPIIFEAAISIDKRSFNRHLVPILIYAVGGTLLATGLTAAIVRYGTTALSNWCTPIPFVEALTFGALISSIDPIAVLSVLSNMGMTDTDTIYVVIFGESLLNDGVAIVLFHTLVHFLDESMVIDSEAVSAAAIHFLVVALGSFLIGVASGILSTIYFWVFHGCQTPLVEVLMFFCWALLPYYVSDGIGWSGIVSVVAAGFVMDLYIIGDKVEENSNNEAFEDVDKFPRDGAPRRRGRIFSPLGQLSKESKTHIGFVTEIIATMMETAIFAYLGLFLFSQRYHWNVWHTIISIAACCLSRAFMIPSLSCIANWIVRMQQKRNNCKLQPGQAAQSTGVVIDRNMQLVLWFAGLRGAMSFALVEHIPLYDEVSGVGTPLKAELKAMTSACIMFTVFVLGGRTYYMMDQLGLAPKKGGGGLPYIQNGEGFSLLAAAQSKDHESNCSLDADMDTSQMTTISVATSTPSKAIRRPRTVGSDPPLHIM